MTLKVRFWHFLTNFHSLYSQNYNNLLWVCIFFFALKSNNFDLPSKKFHNQTDPKLSNVKIHVSFLCTFSFFFLFRNKFELQLLKLLWLFCDFVYHWPIFFSGGLRFCDIDFGFLKSFLGRRAVFLTLSFHKYFSC